MKAIVLFEDEGTAGLWPMVSWRTVFELKIGRKILLDRTAQQLGMSVSGVWTRAWMAEVAAHRCGAPANMPATEHTILVNGRWIFEGIPPIPTAGPAVGVVGDQVAYIVCDAALAGSLSAEVLLDPERRKAALKGVPIQEAPGRLVRYAWDIIGNLSQLLHDAWQPSDAAIETSLANNTDLQCTDQIHIGERTRIHPTAIIDASAGPIYISHDVKIGPYSVIEGPCHIGPGSRIHPHAWLHGPNALGPMCRVGGELDGCILHGYTNKQHAGFLGHAYVGSWVNIGAGTVNSDLKNTYGSVRVPIRGVERDTEQTFFGAVIGDHVKIGINSTIPTGAAIGLASVVSISQTMPKYVPSFSWITDEGRRDGDPNRLLDVAAKVMARRSIDMTDDEVELFLDSGDRLAAEEPRTVRQP